RSQNLKRTPLQRLADSRQQGTPVQTHLRNRRRNLRGEEPGTEGGGRDSRKRTIRRGIHVWTRADDEEDLRPGDEDALPHPGEPRKSLQMWRRDMCCLRDRTVSRLPRWACVLRDRA